MTRPTGWLAIFDNESDPHYPWQPFVQLATQVASMQVWFATKADCEAFIDEIISVGRYPERSRP